MGAVSEMMLEGDLCSECGVFIDGGGNGHPQRCGGCSRPPQKRTAVKSFACPKCSKKFAKQVGLDAHAKDVHK